MKLSALALAALLLASSLPAMAQTGVDQLLLPNPPQAQPTFLQPAPVAAQPVAPSAASQQAAAQAERDSQFQQALEQAVPYTPQQIEEYRRQMDDATRATVVPLNPGVPVSRSLRVSLKPGEQTPILRVQPGVVSTLTFSDLTGQPWPVLSVVTGNPAVYVAQSAGEPGQSNIIVLSATQAHVPSNLVVTLVNYPVPVTIALAQGSPEVDFRVDVQITARGPNAEADMVGTSTLVPTNDSNMLSFLDGVPPSDAKRLKTSSADVEAWRYGDMVYVRTSGDILSPAYLSRAANVSGVNIFVLNEAPVVIVSRGGQMASVRINQ